MLDQESLIQKRKKLTLKLSAALDYYKELECRIASNKEYVKQLRKEIERIDKEVKDDANATD